MKVRRFQRVLPNVEETFYLQFDELLIQWKSVEFYTSFDRSLFLRVAVQCTHVRTCREIQNQPRNPFQNYSRGTHNSTLLNSSMPQNIIKPTIQNWYVFTCSSMQNLYYLIRKKHAVYVLDIKTCGVLGGVTQ